MMLCFSMNGVEMCQDSTPDDAEMKSIHKGYFSDIMDKLDLYLQEHLKDENKP